jgi:16S rRNA processing protein RimM
VTSDAKATDDLLPYGVVGRPHGLSGELTVHPFSGSVEDLELILPLEVALVRHESDRQTLSLVHARPAANSLLARFAGIESRDAAAALTNAELWLPRASLPPLTDDEFYVEDLVGLAVVDLAGRARGAVQASFWNGAQDVLTVVDDAGAELLVPVVPDFIREVDLEARRLVVDPHDDDE